MSQRARLLETIAGLTSNSSGKGMRIGAKIEVDYDDDSFVGCEMENELIAVVVEGLGHDDGDVASWIGLLGTVQERLRDVHMCTIPPGGGGRVWCFPACGDAGSSVPEAESALKSSGKGMRIGEKIEVGYDDDFFAGCEMASELFAVVVRDLGHDHGAVAEMIR
jgi:formylmethanofuran dehydrogenase subunit C